MIWRLCMDPQPQKLTRGTSTYGAIAGGGRTRFAYGFDNVTATGGGGSDLANLYDSNENDTLISFTRTKRN